MEQGIERVYRGQRDEAGVWQVTVKGESLPRIVTGSGEMEDLALSILADYYEEYDDLTAYFQGSIWYPTFSTWEFHEDLAHGLAKLGSPWILTGEEVERLFMTPTVKQWAETRASMEALLGGKEVHH